VGILVDKGKGGVVIDYREGADAVVEKIGKVLDGRKLEYAFDAISENGSHHNFILAMDPNNGQVPFVLGGHREDIPKGIEQSTTMAGSLWKELKARGEKDRLGMGVGEKDFGFAYSRLIGRWLQEQKLKSILTKL
jgi:NADPH:quinone reductase